MEYKRILVTGANGFIGRNLCSFLKEKGYFIRAAVRNNSRDISGVREYVQISDIDRSTDWREAVKDIDCVVHLAGRAHVTDKREVYNQVNVLGTQRLAEQAAHNGVKRFVFISSIKVNGDGGVFAEESRPEPKDHYAVSKLEAEKKVIFVCRNSNMQEIILRLPLVYGPGVKANFLQLIRLVDNGVPLPFGSIHNKRSLIYVGNLCDIIGLCILHSAVVGQIFLISDGIDLSTPQLISMIAKGLNNKAFLLPCPLLFLRIIGILSGRSATIKRLHDSLCVQTTKFSNLTGWKPRFSPEEGIAETVRFYKRCGNMSTQK